MASGGKENRMVFDIRGRRKNAVKIVYAILAVLMGLSLFLVVGSVNLAELFNSSSGGSNAGQEFEATATRIERELKKAPEDPTKLLALTRARVNAANSFYEIGPEEARVPTVESVEQLQLASDSWGKYLKATDEPSAGAAQLMAPNFILLAQNSKTFPEAQANLEAAAQAQRIIMEQRPSLNSLTTLAFYEATLGNQKEAQRLAKEAVPFANTKFERENIDNEIKRYEEVGRSFQASRKKAEKEEGEAATEGNNPLSGGLGSSLSGVGAVSE
jgi:hypothetical protein